MDSHHTNPNVIQIHNLFKVIPVRESNQKVNPDVVMKKISFR